MKALVVYESMWGNTRKVAEAVAVGLGGARVVACDAAGIPDASDTAGLDLLVVGGPTHAFSMTRASTRHDAHQQGAPPGDDSLGLREWLDALPPHLDVPVASFDTRVLKVRNLPGSAARAAEKELRRHHHGRVLDRSSFFVLDVDGPLADGELVRAEQWGAFLAARVDAQRDVTG